MKRPIALFLSLVMLLTLLFSGCDLITVEETKKSKRTTEPTDTSATQTEEIPTTVPPTEAPTEPPIQIPTRELPYRTEIPAEACIYSAPNPDAAYVQTIGEDGTFTIVEEALYGNDQVWGRLKSGLGWVNLTDPMFSGTQVPAVTASCTSKIVLNSKHIRAGEANGEYVVLLTFRPHENVYNVTLREDHPAWSNTLFTTGSLHPNQPLVVGVRLVDFNTFTLTYTDSQGNQRSAYVGQNYVDGPPLTFSP